MAKGRAEVMRDGISECLQFLVGGFKFGGSFPKCFVEVANFPLSSLPLGNVIVRLQDRNGPPLLVSPQRPSAGYCHLGSVGPGLLEFAVPTPGAQQLRVNLLDRRRKYGAQKLVSALADRVLRRPSVQLLSSPIPVSDDVAHITDENGVVREIQQTSLLSSFRYFDLEVVASLAKLSLHAATNGAEPGDQQCERGKNSIVGDIRTRDVERVP